MRKLILSTGVAVVTSLVLLTSCKKDEEITSTDDTNSNLATEQNSQEDFVIPLTQLKTGVEIENSVTTPGTPPAPTNNVDLQLANDANEAFQSTGLTVKINSTDNLSGAYLRLQEENGDFADEYYDISFSSPVTRKGLSTNKTTQKVVSNPVARIASEEADQEIELNFDNTIPAGTFCYEICVYDAAGNISAPQTICVTVEAWGGNASIIGEWEFDRSEPDETLEVDTITCLDGVTTLTYNYYDKITQDDWYFTLNSDGSYNEVYYTIGQSVDYFESEQQCELIYEEVDTTHEQYTGQWAYNEDNETLTVVDFEYTDFIEADNNEIYDDGSLYFEGVTTGVTNGEFFMTENFSDEPYTVIFKSK